MWSKIRKALTYITNLLLKGRQAGLWSEKNSIKKESPK